MKNYTKTQEKDWHYTESEDSKDSYVKSDLKSHMDEETKKFLQKQIDGRVKKKIHSEVFIDDNLKDLFDKKLDFLLGEKINHLISADLQENEGLITGIINLRIKDSHEQIRF